MTVLALILTLYQGHFEIRQERAFASMDERREYAQMRLHNADFRRGDVAIACASQEAAEAAIRLLFGGRA